MTDEIRYRLLKLLETNPELSQRDLAEALGISVGKVNYCIRAFIDKGWVKVRNFRNSKRKLAYSYLLTPRGIEEKAKVTYRFFRGKIREFERLTEEIESLRLEVGSMRRGGKADG